MTSHTLGTFARITARSDHIDECWADLVERTTKFGFPKLLFAAKPHAENGNIHNHSGVILKSTYGAATDKFFFQDRAYVSDQMTLWALHNEGAVSWQVNRDRFLAGEMTNEEKSVHLATRELGLVAGYTYSPSRIGASFVAGFGLSGSFGVDQATVDAI